MMSSGVSWVIRSMGQPACRAVRPAPGASGVGPRRRVWRGGIIAAAAVWCAGHAGAQDRLPAQAPPPPQPQTQPPIHDPADAPPADVYTADPVQPPAPGAAIEAFNSVTGWLRSGAEPGTMGSIVRPNGVEISAVSLRYGGVLVGTAVSTAGPGGVAEAAGAAWAQARGLVQARGDALDVVRTGEFIRGLTVDIELSGALVPIAPGAFVVPPDDPLKREIPPINPGIDGIAARSGPRTAAVTPGAMLRESMPPRTAMDRAVGGVIDDPSMAVLPASELKGRGVEVYRFRVTHLAQLEPGSGPVFLERGGRVVGLESVGTPGAMAGLVRRIATHLMSRRWPGVEPLGIRGRYDPVADEYEPRIAPAIEQALAAAALLRAAGAMGDDAGFAAELRGAGLELIDELAIRIEGEPEGPESDALAAAAVLWAVSMAGAIEGDRTAAMVGRCREAVRGAFDPAGGFGDWIPQGGHGLIALGLASDPASAGAGGDGLAERAVREVFRVTPPERLVSQMPYLLEAELALAGDGPVRSAPLLDEMRRLTLQFEFGPGDAGPDDADLVGGIVFTVGASPLPTAQSLRAIAALGRMLGDERLTPRGGGGHLPLVIRQLEMTRFVAQLTAREAEAHMYPRGARAFGGVRSALWDASMPVEASALGLLAAVESWRAVR